jgi:hypothetical protein
MNAASLAQVKIRKRLLSALQEFCANAIHHF